MPRPLGSLPLALAVAMTAQPVLLLAAPASAQAPAPEPDHARLDYTGAPTCTGEATFRHLVAASLYGSDPFVGDAPAVAHVKLNRRGPVLFVAQLSLDDATGHHPHRDLIEHDCTALVEDAVIVVAGWLRPVLLPQAIEAPRSESPPVCVSPPTSVKEKLCAEDMVSAEVPLPLPRAAPMLPEPKQRLQIRLGVAGAISSVTADRSAVGITADLGVRYTWFSASVEARFDPPLGSTPIEDRTLNYMRIAGAVLPCGHFQWFVGCLKGELGRFTFTGPSPFATPRLYGAVGLHGGFELPVIPSWFFIRATGEVLAVIDPPSIPYENQMGFQVTRTSAGGGLGVLFEWDRP